VSQRLLAVVTVIYWKPLGVRKVRRMVPRWLWIPHRHRTTKVSMQSCLKDWPSLRADGGTKDFW
jgi:hypothetical protein